MMHLSGIGFKQMCALRCGLWIRAINRVQKDNTVDTSLSQAVVPEKGIVDCVGSGR